MIIIKQNRFCEFDRAQRQGARNATGFGWRESGYWTKIKAKAVTITNQRPHGLKYSLTLHDKYNKRILGYDNAHAFKPSRKKYGCNVSMWDHKHNCEDVKRYEFENVAQLMEDFWTDVNETLAEGGKI